MYGGILQPWWWLYNAYILSSHGEIKWKEKKKALDSQLHHSLVFYDANHTDKEAFQMQNINWLIELFQRFQFKGKEWSSQEDFWIFRKEPCDNLDFKDIFYLFADVCVLFLFFIWEY